MPLTPSLERIGPLCRSVEDAALVLAAINGYDPTSASSIDMGFTYDAELDLTKLRVGYSPRWFNRISYDTKDQRAESDSTDSVPVTSAERAALQALKELGVTLVPVTLPDLPNSALSTLLDVESAAVFEELTLSGQDAQLIVQSQPQSWREARLLSAVDYLQKERLRRQVMQGMDELFSNVDVMFGPTYGSYDLFMITNFTGHPGLTLRAGFTESPSRSSRRFLPRSGGPPRACSHGHPQRDISRPALRGRHHAGDRARLGEQAGHMAAPPAHRLARRSRAYR